MICATLAPISQLHPRGHPWEMLIGEKEAEEEEEEVEEEEVDEELIEKSVKVEKHIGKQWTWNAEDKE